MPAVNESWYARNEQIAYPIDDSATAIDDSGNPCPSNIIVDLNLRFSIELAKYAFISAINVSKSLVSVVISSCLTNPPDDTNPITPLAVISIPQPVQRGRVYTLQAQQPGAAGWIVFGSGVIDASYRGRFSNINQSLLAAKGARPYVPPVVSGVRAFGADSALTGLVHLKASPPLTITKQQMQIEGILRDALVFRLEQPQTGGATQADNILQQFSGPCGGRPESKNCGDPAPIEFISGVGPNCDGEVIFQITGPVAVAQIFDQCGIVLESQLKASDLCPPENLADSLGSLPSDNEGISVPGPGPWVGPPPFSVSIDTSSTILPYVDCWLPDNIPHNFVPVHGVWIMVLGSSPTYRCPPPFSAPTFSYASNDPAINSLTVFTLDRDTLFRRVYTDLKIVRGPMGSKHRAGIVFDYNPMSWDMDLQQYVAVEQYFVAEMDWEQQEIHIHQIKGGKRTSLGYAITPGIQLDEWFSVMLTIRPADTSGAVEVVMVIQDVDDGSIINQLGPVFITNFHPRGGMFGFLGDRSLAYFSYFELRDYYDFRH